MSKIKVIDINETVEQVVPEQPIEEATEQPVEAPIEEVKEEQPVEAIEETTQLDIKNEDVEETNEEAPKKRLTQKDKIQCKKCLKEMTIKSYKYSHEKNCQGQITERPVKPQSKPKPKAKPKPIPQQVQEEQVGDFLGSGSTRAEPDEPPHQNPPWQNKQPAVQPLQPVNSLTQHYQLLQNEYIKQKQQKYTALCKNIFATNLKNVNNNINILKSKFNIFMSSLSLDGSTTYIGTDFLKLEITDTSNLATEAYVNTQVAQGGGSGYTDGEIDTFLSGKVDLTNLNQTINGKIDISANPIPLALIDATNGHKMRFTHGKHIDVFTEPETTALTPLYLNYFNQGNVRVGDTAGSLSINNNNPNSKTLSCNGDAEFLTTLTVSNTLPGTFLRTNRVNSIGDVNLEFQPNSVNFMRFDATADKIELDVALNSTSDIASTILKGETLSNYNANGLTLDTSTTSIYIKNNTALK